LLIKKIFLILLAGLILWAGISCAPRPLRDTDTGKRTQTPSQDRAAIRSDIEASQKPPSDSPSQETAKQARPMAPRRTVPVPAPAPAPDSPLVVIVESESAQPQQPSAQQTFPGHAPGAAPTLQADAEARSPMQGMPGALAPVQPANKPVMHRGQFTLNFDDADVYAVIHTVFGEILKVNYVVDPRVKGRVTFRAIAPIPAEKVLPLMEVILRLNGTGMMEESGLYRIVPISDIQRKPQLFIYQVQNGKAKDIAAVLQQIFVGGKGGAADRPPGLVKAGPTGSASPEPMPAHDSFAAGSPSRSATSLNGDGAIVSESVRIIADEITNTIAVLSPSEDYATIAKAIEQIDVVPRQVIIESMIASVSLDDNLSLGVAALLKGKVSGNKTEFGLNADLLTATALAQAGFTFLVTDTAGVVRGLLTALANETKAKVLASPHILVSDNRDAKIQVGQQVPLITSETYGVAGVSPQRNYSYRDIGIILKVKPRINEGGLVALEISQEISTYAKISVGGTEQLLLNKTDASTSLVVQDGQTIVIGGLIREDTSKSASGLPFLSRIPFIGWLFGGTEREIKRQELIILLTPRVIKNQKEAKNLSGEMINKMAEASQGRINAEDLLGKKPPEGSDPSPWPKP
jgi:type II secretory pathway component GspD/PulD (secretin)